MAQDTVTVACKMPNGLQLRLFKETKQQEPVPGGGYREVSVFVETGDVVRLNGYASEEGKSPRAMVTDQGYALTPGVPKEFWEIWIAQNQDLDLVKNKLIFAHASVNSVQSESRDHDQTRSGLEKMAQQGDPRSPKSPTTDGIAPAA